MQGRKGRGKRGKGKGKGKKESLGTFSFFLSGASFSGFREAKFRLQALTPRGHSFETLQCKHFWEKGNGKRGKGKETMGKGGKGKGKERKIV